MNNVLLKSVSILGSQDILLPGKFKMGDATNAK
jgi:hypothetical protein